MSLQFKRILSIKSPITHLVFMVLVVLILLFQKESKINSLNKKIERLDFDVVKNELLVQNSESVQKFQTYINLSSLDDIKIFNKDENDILLSNQLDSLFALVLFKNDMCIDCIDKELVNLKTFQTSHPDIPIVIIGQGFKKALWFADKRFKTWSPNLYWSDKSPLSHYDNYSGTPSITIINNGKPQLSYIGLKQTNVNFTTFLEKIKIYLNLT